MARDTLHSLRLDACRALKERNDALDEVDKLREANARSVAAASKASLERDAAIADRNSWQKRALEAEAKLARFASPPAATSPSLGDL
jgi:hypothetical protein